MRNLHIPFLISAIAILVSTPALAVINNGGGGETAAPCVDSDGNGVCQMWCHVHNRYQSSQLTCDRKCWVSYCKSPAPFTKGNPVRGTGAEPIVNGKPVQAPPPPSKGGKGGRPINAAPVIYGGSKAPPSSGGSTTVLERGGGGGGGRR
jgi:hypothetical protein